MEELQNEEIIEETKEEKKWCVYMHTSPNGKFYIGITSQIPEKRWINGYGYHNNQYFWRAIQKYGWDNFEHKILYDGLSKEDACQKEIDLIATYDSTNPQNGYNISPGGEIPLVYSDEVRRKISESHKGMISPLRGIPRTDDVKQKISASLKGRYVGENNPNYGNQKLLGENSPSYGSGLAVVQFNKNGDRISEYVSARQAERATGIPQANIRKCCKGIITSIGGFMWRFAKDCKEEKISPYINPKCKPIVQLDLSNNLIQSYNSVKTAANYLSIPSSDITQCCRGITKTCGGFRWMYKEEYEQQFENLNKEKKEI